MMKIEGCVTPVSMWHLLSFYPRFWLSVSHITASQGLYEPFAYVELYSKWFGIQLKIYYLSFCLFDRKADKDGLVIVSCFLEAGFQLF